MDTKPKWIERDGAIYLSVTTDGTTGKEWITRLENKGFYVSRQTEKVLRSQDFKSSNGCTYELAILMRNSSDRKNVNMKEVAKKLNYSAPSPEVACLILEKFYDREMADKVGRIIVMSDHVKDFSDTPWLFCLENCCLGLAQDDGFIGFAGTHYYSYSFAYAVSCVSS